ncbi:MAG: histidinol dehydrogenase [Acidimicrobiales bacterium]|nr:histidinol dehydrogenase [Acidimicrobiales bacterium]
MLQRLDLRGITGPITPHLPRPEVDGDEPVDAVRAILDSVRRDGDAAIRDYTERFDGVALDDLRVPTEALRAALDATPADVRDALELAHHNVAEYHRHQRPADQRYEADGIVVRSLFRPVERAGCYVPGGRALYPSTVLMTAVPARVAGVDQVVLCVPPGPDGLPPEVTMAAAAVAEVDEVYAVGGAQAIAAMAYGTETIAPVDVIVGPGNIYVAIAKREVAGVVGVPSSFAGPSEVVVIADGTDPVELAAIDVVVQAEHGPHGLAWLVTWSPDVADAAAAAVAEIVAASPRRADIEATLAAAGIVALVDGPEQAMAVANAIAPEHLQLMTADNEALVAATRHAGAVFCGPSAPASFGDYIAGPSHVLPTNGSARFSQSLTTFDFVKDVHVVDIDAEAADRLAPHVEALATAEGLAAHAQSARMRRARQ